MDKNMTLAEFDKNLELYKIKIYEQKVLIDQLKNKLYEEEQIKKYYINKVNIMSKL